MSHPLTRSFAEIRKALLNKQELALVDVREEAPFAEAHPLFAANIPLSKLELEVYSRIPRLDTSVTVYDNGEGLAQVAAERLRGLGYVNVSLLEGGLDGWRRAGGELFIDVNVPSKAFGELVESQRHTPSLAAEEVQALLDSEADVVVLDARRFDEYQTMSIPTGISVPWAELVLRARELAPDPATRIIVNCAGRTRSIIGTQSLINSWIANPVSALRNGTIGWTLAGQTLQHGQSRRFAPTSEEHRHIASQDARRVADKAFVGRATLADLQRWQQESTRSTYLFDVRTPEEFETQARRQKRPRHPVHRWWSRRGTGDRTDLKRSTDGAGTHEYPFAVWQHPGASEPLISFLWRGSLLWRGGLPPLECVALPKIFDYYGDFGAAAQPNGGKPPRHKSSFATSDQRL